VKRTLVSLLVLGAVAGTVLPVTLATTAQAATPGPVNLAPDDSGTYQKNVVLTWDEVAGATGYEVQITDEGFGTEAEPFEDTAKSNRYVAPVDLPRGDYHWRVRATLPGGTSDWSSAADLVRGWDPSIAPVLTHLGGDNFDWSVSWTPVTDASFYEVQISPTDIEGENTGGPPYVRGDEIICFTTHTTFTGSLISKGSETTVAEGADCTGTLDGAEDYSIRVRARDGFVDTRTSEFAEPANSCTGVWQATVGDGWTGIVPECSGWSNSVTGLVLNGSTAEPAEVTGLATDDPNSSCDNASPCSDTPVMSWNQDPDATFYRVYLSRDRSGTDYDRLYENVIGTHFQMYSTMADRELPWYWRVQACSVGTDDDMCGPISAAASFTVDNKALRLVGAAPVTTDPDIDERFVDFTVPNEILQADHQAKAFRVQVSTKADFSAVVHTGTFDQEAGDATVTTYRWDDVSDGDYFWRYRAIDQTGLTSPWTEDASLQFTVDAAIPQVSIKDGSGWGLTDSITLTSDKALSGVNNNTLGVQLKGGARLDGKVTQISAKSWKFTPDTRWIANAAYVPYVAASVTASNGKVAVGDDVARRPSGLVDSKTASMKKTDGDFDWKTLSASDAVGKSYVAAKHNKSNGNVPEVSVRFGGTKVSLVACKSSVGGLADIYVDGTKLKTVDLYRASSTCGEVWSKSGLDEGLHTLVVKVTGKKSADSSGSYVGVDAVKAG
jgi:hypothetical protein